MYFKGEEGKIPSWSVDIRFGRGVGTRIYREWRILYGTVDE